ncbi:flagellar biosynthesis MinD [Legionella feeleii]|uniref:Flagellar biosynthesis MinD n=1 Tax=Legionella feeleii TaxID=453 RepID=A0A378ISI6_9GAMM|nr:flagellar biosynthesis MinD [Legionella feeleii]
MSKAKKILDQAAGLRNLSRSKPVKVIAVSAGKGGVGKSNVSVNLAVALAKKNKNVLLLDADLGLANIDIMLGLHTKYNLSHVVQDFVISVTLCCKMRVEFVLSRPHQEQST